MNLMFSAAIALLFVIAIRVVPTLVRRMLVTRLLRKAKDRFLISLREVGTFDVSSLSNPPGLDDHLEFHVVAAALDEIDYCIRQCGTIPVHTAAIYPLGNFYISNPPLGQGINPLIVAAINRLRGDVQASVQSRVQASSQMKYAYSWILRMYDLHCQTVERLYCRVSRRMRMRTAVFLLVSGLSLILIDVGISANNRESREVAEIQYRNARYNDFLTLLEIEVRKEAGPDVENSFAKHCEVFQFAKEHIAPRLNSKEHNAAMNLVKMLRSKQEDPVHWVSGAVSAVNAARVLQAYASVDGKTRIDAATKDMNYTTQALLEYALRSSSLGQETELEHYVKICMDSRTGTLLLFAMWPEYIQQEKCKPVLYAFRDSLREGWRSLLDASQMPAQATNSDRLKRFAQSLDRRFQLLEIMCSNLSIEEKAERIDAFLTDQLQKAIDAKSNLPQEGGETARS
jgi:hypothetical protein